MSEYGDLWAKDHAWHEDLKEESAIDAAFGPSPETRTRLQRDIDRIVWSCSFKRLANKTQVYSLYLGDHQRQRLTHSLEVAQLATDLSTRLKYNVDLCRAMALAHDVGHTPFGHAGERAINDAFAKYVCMHHTQSSETEHPPCRPHGACLNHGNNPQFKGLSGFSHYEQGLDAVSYIESPREGLGLGLTPTTMAGILKHCKEEELERYIDASKYSVSKNTSPEAQIVRVCDKISYCVTDLEDSVLMNTMSLDDITDAVNSLDGDLATSIHTHLATQRRGDEDAFTSARRFGSMLVKQLLAAIAGKSNLHAPDAVLSEIHGRVKSASVGHATVERADRRGAFIVSCLLCEYLAHPELILPEFRAHYRRKETQERIRLLYRLGDIKRVRLRLRWCPLEPVDCSSGCSKCAASSMACPQRQSRAHIPERGIFDIVCAKDYVAGMTDNYAEERYRRDVDCPLSRTTWRDKALDGAPAWPQY